MVLLCSCFVLECVHHIANPLVFQTEAPRPATRAEGMLHAHERQQQPRAVSRGA
jgi:hypothetical protein